MKYLPILIVLATTSVLGSPHESCLNAHNRFVDNYKKLFRNLPAETKLQSEAPVIEMLRIRKDACKSNRSESIAAMRSILEGISEHSGKIGVLLPLSGLKANEGKAVLSGMKSLYPFRGVKFNQRTVVRDTRGMAANAEHILAKMIFQHRVSVIIGGLTKGEATLLRHWSNTLKLPALILNQKTTSRSYSNVFHLFPSEKSLTSKLATEIRKRRYKRIALLHPLKNSAQSISFQLEARLAKMGIDTQHNYAYKKGDYASMEAAAKKIFKIDPGERRNEYQDLVKKAKKEAKKAGVKFNPSLVALDPIVEIDAIFIADNFRTIRHFTKLFEFLGVDHLPLIGTPQWRSPGLIDPPNRFLEGALFVDYIGDYRMLPKGIVAPPKGNSRFFTTPEFSNKIDYMIIGQHAIKTADRSLSHPILNRHQLHTRIENLENKNSRYFESGKVFNKDRTARWPSFIFNVTGSDINPIRSTGRTSALLKKSGTKNQEYK